MVQPIDSRGANNSAPNTVFGKVPPMRRKNQDMRDREHLTPEEVEQLLKAAGARGRHPHRDRTLIMVMYRHGLRVIELTELKWSAIDLKTGLLHVRRRKSGTASTHPLRGPEIRALRKLHRESDESPYVFTTERGGPLTPRTVHHIVAQAGAAAGLPFPAHPHMLRHACGYYLANRGIDTRAIQHYLGHRNIQHTVRYTALASDRFNDFWTD